MNVMQTEKLTVGYGKHVVVKDISFSLEAGKILTFIGPNGSGKSTILKSITNQLKMLGGAVYLNGNTMGQMKESEIAKQLSIVMTQRLRTELMTCKDVVATGRYPYTGRFGILTKEDWKKVDAAMELVQAKEIADLDFQKISDGQRQRVMLARAICQETPVMILDEPTSYLDMRFKLDILQNIRTMAREKKIAVVMSLHELDLAQKVSDLIACVDGDRIRKLAPPEDIFKDDCIQKLYHVPRRSFDPLLASMYLPANTAKPKCFVIAGGGTAIPVYQKLQREHTPFAAGILSKNDVEYSIVQATASEWVATESFCPIEEVHVNQAKKLIDECESCICTLQQFGEFNKENKILLEYARVGKKLVEKEKGEYNK